MMRALLALSEIEWIGLEGVGNDIGAWFGSRRGLRDLEIRDWNDGKNGERDCRLYVCFLGVNHSAAR